MKYFALIVVCCIVLIPNNLIANSNNNVVDLISNFSINCNILINQNSSNEEQNEASKNLLKLFNNEDVSISNFFIFQTKKIDITTSAKKFAYELKKKYTGSKFNLDFKNFRIFLSDKDTVSATDSGEDLHIIKFYKANFSLETISLKIKDKNQAILNDWKELSLSFIIVCDKPGSCKILSIKNNVKKSGNNYRSLDPDKDHFLTGEDDECPHDYGTAKGCSDFDGDGFHNGDEDGLVAPEDKCPYEYAPPQKSYYGCLDSDADQIIDELDGCPQEYGPRSTNGCPDSDGDGIKDSEDDCPTEYGNNELGCPDFDGDGIIDGEDSCPCLVGDRSTYGCPDSDGDGILDGLDNCNIFGTSADGCSERFKYKGRTEKVFTEKEAIIHLQIVDPYLIAATENGEFGIFNLDRSQSNPKRLPSLIEKEKKPFLIEDQYETFYVNNSKDIIIITSTKSKLESSERKQYSKKKLTYPYLSFAPLNSDINNVIISADSAKSIIREANLSFAKTNFSELLNKLGEDITLEKEILVDNEVYKDIEDKNSYLFAIINNNLYLYKNHIVFYNDNYRKLYKLENQPQKLENRLNVKSGTFDNTTGELFIAGEDGVIYIYQKENVPLNSND